MQILKTGINSPINLLFDLLGRLLFLNCVLLDFFSSIGSKSFFCSFLNLCYFSDFFLMGENMIWTENASNYLGHIMNLSPSCLTFTAYPFKANVFLLAMILNWELIFRHYLSQTLNLHQNHCISWVLFCYSVCAIGTLCSQADDFAFGCIKVHIVQMSSPYGMMQIQNIEMICPVIIYHSTNFYVICNIYQQRFHIFFQIIAKDELASGQKQISSNASIRCRFSSTVLFEINLIHLSVKVYRGLK